MRTNYRAVYVAFDPHPSYKGASTHIYHVCKVLAADHGPMLLLTLKSNLDPIQSEDIHQVCFESDETNVLKRAIAFTQWVYHLLQNQHNLVIGHFRDVWGGLAILRFPHIQSIFEVNGLPSIEMPFRFPAMAETTIEKLASMERYCLEQASNIITPSFTTKACLKQRGCPENKIEVIPNGATIPNARLRPNDLPEKYMVYMGALQPWQGVDVLLKTLRYLEDVDVPLVICSSYTQHHSKLYMKFAEKLGVENRIIWKYQLDKDSLNGILQHALFSVAPLTACSRNIAQGCSPLKILESMACGTPVISTTLPAVEEIIENQVDGMLCRADRPAELARTIRLAVDYPEHTKKLGEQARKKILANFTWKHAQQSLREVYNRVLTFSY
jgi:glycosyltransferase involved in cell wall biosynthesis